MMKRLAIFLITLMLVSCGEHRGQNISEFTGDYRFYAGISEFFDCKESVKYYVADTGIHAELQSLYLQLNLKEKEDIYIKVTGYLKEEKQLEGIDPINVFVAVELLEHDVERGCNIGNRKGN